MKNNKIKIQVNGIKVANKIHLDAQTRFPARIFENKKAYKRSRNKIETHRELQNYSI